jgi:hypothetical protein
VVVVVVVVVVLVKHAWVHTTFQHQWRMRSALHMIACAVDHRGIIGM